MNIIFKSLLVQLVKYDVHTTRKIKSIRLFYITYYYYINTGMCQQLKKSEVVSHLGTSGAAGMG